MSLSQLAVNCTSSVISYPTIFGAQFTAIEAALVQNYSTFVLGSSNFNHGDIEGKNLSFCNVTLTHTHPGQNDTIKTKVWLPIQPAWNSRLQAVGGAGYVAGLQAFTDNEMSGAIGEGYATVTSNGGVPNEFLSDWALLSPGNVDLFALQNFGHVALKDSAIAAQSVVESFYGTKANFSYWSGCSQGGRQGLMFAQKYPEVFDGIAASSPAIQWDKLALAVQFPQQIMHERGEYPNPCEIDALTTAAIADCGKGGIIDDPDSCHFDPYTLVGTVVNCTSSGTGLKITEAAAVVADAAWNGARDADGKFLWYTPGHAANLTAPILGVARTTCSTNGTCTASDISLLTDWIRFFVEKDPNFDFNSMSREDYVHAFRTNVLEYSDFGTASPDLSEFRKAGGKMITYQGLADEIIPFRSTRYYYDTVTALDPNVHDFYRLFESPGLGHCYGGVGGYPSGTFDALVKWVEEGVVPELLEATSITNRSTILFPYSTKAEVKTE
ncbi:feruloyl esteras-like protein B precursor [Massarina eburnea CBS 473.64]|uniref:Carboxylic ester hydrolase n=1 Tax=Massarina eburnea CBS 473.64 TaxID=1395130 RepID=A0A6A6SB55_9PLEO|nr:feruloyl esteras-like protein B precursor [Massarina eburnea CBS 473.64]